MSLSTYNEDPFDFDDEEDELDLLQLVSNDSNDLNQYLVFKGSNLEWYAMNVSKIEEVMVYDENISISYNNDKKNIICATADIRNSMTSLIYFDDWYENKRLDDSEYELIILANYGGHKLGIIVKEVAHITAIEADKMSDNTQSNAKSTFIAKIIIEGKEEMCTIYDGDQMLLDVFDNIEEQEQYTFDTKDLEAIKNKLVFFADDSKFVRNLVENLFKTLNVSYKIFNDGSFLVEYLHSHPNEKVDLFVTDLEMPNLSGREVIVSIRKDKTYANSSIIIHTNMSNSVMDTELRQVGATQVIAKMNMLNLGKAMIKELM
ncbi:MAG: hypothetical protein COA44_14295 [Arcobacter sp.]|nr:MAG: hypothetical protein COA44_14295 [Arcobacter sp.]